MVADPDYMSWTACRYWNIFAKSGSGFYVMNCWIYNEPWLRIRIRILSQELLYNWTMVADPDFMSWTASCIYIYNEPLMRIRIGPRWLQTLMTLTSNFLKLNLAFCQIKSKFYTKEMNERFFLVKSGSSHMYFKISKLTFNQTNIYIYALIVIHIVTNKYFSILLL